MRTIGRNRGVYSCQSLTICVRGWGSGALFLGERVGEGPLFRPIFFFLLKVVSKGGFSQLIRLQMPKNA
jgi:hypothetical protein